MPGRGEANVRPAAQFACPVLRVGKVEVVRLLIVAGANVSHVDIDGFTPASQAARNRHWEVVHLLAEAGANFDELDASGFTARHYVAKRCSVRWKRRLATLIGRIDPEPPAAN